jgi:4,4'-diaponeurosporenoate glycosyltransferase
VFFNLIMAAGTVPHGLFGQMLLVDRESYCRVGGHEIVKGRILENFYLAERFREAGIPVRSRTGKGMVGFRMYPNGPAELIEGWIKGFASGARQTGKPVLLLIVAWLTGMMLPVGCLPFSAWAGLLYLLFAAQLGFMFRQVGAFRWYTALLYPVPLIFFFVVFAVSVLRSGRRVTWKGRTIHAD